MSNVKLSFEPDASDADQKIVQQGLSAYNFGHISDYRPRPINFFLRDDAGTIQGGIVGRTIWNWLEIKWLWIAEAYRGKGHGTALLLAAEDEARKDHCRNAMLDTLSFQARPFYEKLGYVVFGECDDYTGGHKRYYMRKKL